MDEEIYKCWICMKVIDDYMLLPYENEYFGEQLTIFKNTFIIKEFDAFINSNIPSYKFLYYTCCNNCVNNYLNYYGNFYKLLKKREICGKM